MLQNQFVYDVFCHPEEEGKPAPWKAWFLIILILSCIDQRSENFLFEFLCWESVKSFLKFLLPWDPLDCGRKRAIYTIDKYILLGN